MAAAPERAIRIPAKAGMLSRAESNLIHGLQQRKTRDTHGLFLAEGTRVVEELLESGYDLKVAVAATSLEDNERGAALIHSIAGRCAIHRVADHELKKIAATDNPQGILVVAHIPATTLASLQPTERALVMLADGVQDPGNLGTLVRIADAFAASAVLALPGTVDFWNPKTVRASAGSAFHLPLLNAAHGEAADWLRGHQFQILGAEVDGVPITEVALSSRVALLVGNEGAGLSDESTAMMEQRVGIQMPGRAESLNVAVASGILLHVISRR